MWGPNIELDSIDNGKKVWSRKVWCSNLWFKDDCDYSLESEWWKGETSKLFGKSLVLVRLKKDRNLMTEHDNGKKRGYS